MPAKPKNRNRPTAVFVRAARAATKMTQTEFGALFSREKANISAWECGAHEPSFEQMDSMSKLSGLSLPASVTMTIPGQLARRVGDAIVVPHFDAPASMGSGTALPEHDQVIDHISLTRDWVGKNVSYSRAENLAIIAGLGHSMMPIFNDGDLMLVDRGIRDVKIDGVYVFTHENNLYIKTLQRRPGGVIRAISESNPHNPWDIALNDETFAVLGRVVWAWNGKKI